MDETKKFIDSSYELLKNYEHKGRYYHSLTPTDNSPTVVHRKTNQLTYIIKGNGYAYLNDAKQEVHAGTMLFIEAGTQHRFVAISNELVLFHIHVPDEGRECDRYIIEGNDYNRYEK